MPKFIDVEDLLASFDDIDKRFNSEPWMLNEIEDVVNDQPIVEATVFPCKIGDTVWFVGTSTTNRLNLGVIETTVEKLILKKGGIYMKLACNAMYETSCKSIGKTVFFTQEGGRGRSGREAGETVRRITWCHI